ncbi:MAG: hypothetical protein Q9214_004954 [Letrouitia sp. 1 TL-2023]
MELLNKSNCPGIIRVRAYRRYRKHKKHRIYMEYARYGDLGDLRQRYLAFNFSLYGHEYPLPANALEGESGGSSRYKTSK